MHRRSFLTLGIPAAVAIAVSSSSASGVKASTQKKSALRPLHKGSRLRAINAGTWLDPETDFGPLVKRCEVEGWTLEVPESVKRQWQWFSGTDQQRADDLERAWNNPSLDGLIYVGAGWGGARVLEAGFRFPPSTALDPGVFRQQLDADGAMVGWLAWRHPWIHHWT